MPTDTQASRNWFNQAGHTYARFRPEYEDQANTASCDGVTDEANWSQLHESFCYRGYWRNRKTCNRRAAGRQT